MAASTSTDLSTSLRASHNGNDAESLTPLEQEVLDEYARLLGNLNDVRHFLALQ